MTDSATLYTLLVSRAEIAVTKPLALDERELLNLIEAIELAVRAPAETRLIFDEEKLLARCCMRILEMRRAGDEPRMRRWEQIVGVLLPMVREDWYVALKSRGARPSTTDQDYRKR